MLRDELQQLVGHPYLELTTRGNTAIEAALTGLKSILIPEEGGWLGYRDIPRKKGITVTEIKCQDAVLDLVDLRKKVGQAEALLYQNSGGYFAEQPCQQIYEICQKNNCLVIMDISGAIGTKLVQSKYADFLICSFGNWKLLEAKGGGFISARTKSLFEKLEIKKLGDPKQKMVISEQLKTLPLRIKLLSEKVNQVKNDLANLEIVHPADLSFVVVVKFKNNEEKEKIINYCRKQQLEWTECPRYIRLNQKAISIEVKRWH